MNKRHAVLLLVTFVVLLGSMAMAVTLVAGGGLAGAVVVSALVAGVGAVAWLRSDAVALAVSHARPADPIEHARLHNLVDGLCTATGLPRPSVYVVDDDALNAFSTGRDPRHASVAVTTGLLAALSRIELEGVLAHELSHVKNRDTLVSTLAVTTIAPAAVVSDWVLRSPRAAPRASHGDDQPRSAGVVAAALAAVGLVLLPFAAVAGRIMQLTLAGEREVLADVSGMSITRYPPGLASALEKMRDGGTTVGSGSRLTAHLWIEPPLSRPEVDAPLGRLARLFDTHPPVEQRIQSLREM